MTFHWPVRPRCRGKGIPLAVLLLGVLLPWACARISPIRAPASVAADCWRYFEELDVLTDAAGVRDAGAVRVDGARYLRADRFLASFAGEVTTAEGYAEWLERLRATDAERRAAELINLGLDRPGDGPASPFPGLSPIESVRECGRRLVDRDLRTAERRAWLHRRVAVPDAYSTWRQTLGLYPLTRLALAEGVGALHRELRRSFMQPDRGPMRRVRAVRYAPEAAETLTADRVAQLLQAASRNALQIPDPGADELDRLYDTFAPAWEVETRDTADRIGAVRWDAAGRPEVDVGSPAVYRFASHTRFHRNHLLQLNYLIWFPERPASRLLDLYSGRLDGLIWRVTLSPTGRVLAYDTIHPCGCYYLLFPGLGYRVVQPSAPAEPVLSPYPLAEPKTGQRLVVRISAGRHFVLEVAAGEVGQPDRIYHARELRELSSLPTADGGRRSLFDRDGLVADTDRPERFLLWPSGIASPGAMRQPGTHAIAMLGRRHFDDARLFEELLRPL